MLTHQFDGRARHFLVIELARPRSYQGNALRFYNNIQDKTAGAVGFDCNAERAMRLPAGRSVRHKRAEGEFSFRERGMEVGTFYGPQGSDVGSIFTAPRF